MLRLLLFLLVTFGAILLFLALIEKSKFDRSNKIVTSQATRPKTNKKKQHTTKKGKRRQQVELELLIISNSRFLRALGLIDKNIKLKLLLAGVAVFISSFIAQDMNEVDRVVAFVVALILVILVPGIVASRVVVARIRSITVALPGFIDLVASCVQSGMTIDVALKRVASDFEILNPSLTYVMTHIIRKSDVIGLVEALNELNIALPIQEIRMFTSVVIQSINFGSSMYEQLIQLSADIRELQLLRIEEKMGTLSAKMSIPLIVFIMFPTIVLIIAPGVMRMGF